MRIQGGKGIIQGPRNFMGMMPEGEYVARTVEGDNNMTRSVVIFGQGSKKGHAFLTDEINAAQDGNNSEFKKLFKAHTRDILDNMKAARRMGRTGEGGDVPSYADEDTVHLFKQINRLSAAFNFTANVAMSTLGGAIQYEQPTSMRLGQVYGNMMMSYYTLWYFHKVQKSNPEFLPLAKWAVEKKLYEAEEALEDLIENFPLEDGMKLKLAGVKATISNERIQSFLHSNVFPKGRQYKKPADKLESQVSDTITQPGAVRDWIGAGVLMPDDENNVIRHIDKAYRFITEQEAPVLEKLAGAMDRRAFKKLTAQDAEDFIAATEALGILDAPEVDILKKAEQYRKEVVEVDYYEPENMRKGEPVKPFKSMVSTGPV